MKKFKTYSRRTPIVLAILGAFFIALTVISATSLFNREMITLDHEGEKTIVVEQEQDYYVLLDQKTKDYNMKVTELSSRNRVELYHEDLQIPFMFTVEIYSPETGTRYFMEDFDEDTRVEIQGYSGFAKINLPKGTYLVKSRSLQGTADIGDLAFTTTDITGNIVGFVVSLVFAILSSVFSILYFKGYTPKPVSKYQQKHYK